MINRQAVRRPSTILVSELTSLLSSTGVNRHAHGLVA
jgi:hypothetical protein